MNWLPGTRKEGVRRFRKEIYTPSEFLSLKTALGVRPQRGFAWTGLLGRTVVVAVTLGLSWLLTSLVFGAGTGWGAVYEESLLAAVNRVPKRRQPVGEAAYERIWEGSMLKFAVHLAPEGGEGAQAAEGIVTMWAGRLEELSNLPDSVGVNCGVGREGYIGYGLAWQFEGDTGKGVKALGGEGADKNCRVLFSYEPSQGWAPYARDVVQEIPRGALPPLIGMVLAEAVTGARHEGAEVELGDTVADGLTRQIAGDVTQGLNYEGVEQVLGRVALMYGPIQFLSLAMAFVSVILLVASLWFGWARHSVDIAMNLIPYIGFFGTLLGMGGALAVLGEADLSDPVSKATSLGPIGSRLALAIETTKWALICYSAVSVLVLVRDSVFRRSEVWDDGGRVDGAEMIGRAEV